MQEIIDPFQLLVLKKFTSLLHVMLIEVFYFLSEGVKELKIDQALKDRQIILPQNIIEEFFFNFSNSKLTKMIS